MIFQSLKHSKTRRPLHTLVGAVMVFVLTSFAGIPNAEAQCTGGSLPSGGGTVTIEACSDAQATTNVPSIDVPVPAGVISSGDMLIAIVGTDDVRTFNVPAGWEIVEQGTSDSNSLGVFKRISGGTEPASYTISWIGGNSQAYGHMLHLTSINGTVTSALLSSNGNDGTPPAPAITGGTIGDMIIRIAGLDQTDGTGGSVPAGHTEITRKASGGGNNGSNRVYSAYLVSTTTGIIPQINFTGGSNEEFITVSLSVAQGAGGTPTPTPFLCPGIDGSIVAGQLVVLEECAETKNAAALASISLDTPPNAVAGDFLVAFITADGNRVFTPPGGWAEINQATNSGMAFGAFSKFATAADLGGSHVFGITNSDNAYGYIIRLSGASGRIISAFQSSPSDNNIPIAPAIATAIANTLVVRAHGADDDDLIVDPGVIVAGQNNITADASNAGGSSNTGQSVYLNQTATGGTGTVNFSLTNNEEWRAGTLGIEPLEFLFNHDGSLSLCAIGEITISAVDSTGAVVPGFVGVVNLSTSNGAGTWAIGPTSDPAQGVNFDNSVGGSGTNGQAFYEFVAADGGSVVLEYTTDTVGAMNFNLQYFLGPRTFTETQIVANDPILVVDNNCEFRIEHDGVAGTCGMEAITITLVDSAGNQAFNYANETVDITVDTLAGDFSINTGGGILDPDPDNDNNGAVSYSFVAADNGQVILNYTNINTGPVNFDAMDNNPGNLYPTDASFDADLVFSACEIRIILADNTRDVCSIAQVTFEIRAGGGLVTAYDGDIDITTDSSTGDWSGTVPGTLDNAVNGTGNGEANYAFAGSEGGFITLDFRNPFVNAVLSFGVSGTASNGAALVLNGAFDPSLDVAACSLVIDVASATNQSDVCRAGELVTYTITDRDSGTAVDFDGLVVFTVATGAAAGDYSVSGGAGGFGVFDNGGGNDGIATYQFDPDAGDAGVLELLYSLKTADTVTLDASSSGIVTNNADGQIEFQACEFRIEFTDASPGFTDVCSLEQVRISIFDIDGDIVDDYAGTINLSTSSSDGTWSIDSAVNAIVDPVNEDGAASYQFDGTPVTGDLGSIDLFLAHTASNPASVNIDVTDTITTDPGNPGSAFDPNLAVELCTFQISYDGGGASTHLKGSVSACAIQQVTIEIFNRLSNKVTNYAGKVNISTSFNHGNWSIGDGAGTLVPNPDNDDNGAVSYQFVAGDGGDVTLDFSNLNAETLNIDVVDEVEGLPGVIVEDGAADPDLEVTSCLPAISDQSCVAGSSTTVTIDARNPNASLRGRMVVMALTFEGDGVVTGATFDGTAMTLIRSERIEAGTFDNLTEMWGILDAALPALAGTYTVDFTHTDDAPAMCAFYLTELKQAFPQPDGVTPEDGAVNGTQLANTSVASTTITTTANNSFVFSIVGNGSGGNIYNNVSPDPPITRLFNGPDPGSGEFAGSSGISPVQSAITIDETWGGGAPNRHTHIVAAFEPLISGPPVAVGYVPVILFQTYAGNISYRAIGATLRTANNATDSCAFVTSSSATLNLPDEAVPAGPDSTVTAAFLYWFGSGDADLATTDFAITFTDPSLTATNITAAPSEQFIIDNVGGANNNDYFAGFKDVTALVTGNGVYTVSNLTVQNIAPWSNTQACAGGWALVVVYDNAFEQLRVINLFHGFQPFQNSSFTLVPRNFKMAQQDLVANTPNGQVTHITVEGDETLFNGDESLQIQDTPGGITFTPLVTPYNPLQAEFNGTVSRPLYTLTAIPGGSFYLFDPGLGEFGYEIDFPGPDAPPPPAAAGDEIGASWGVDIDTHYVSGDGDNTDGDPDLLSAFAGEEKITTRYSSGQDLVLLISEVISVTNAPIAEIEVFKTESGTFTVDSTGIYQYQVRNNGNGASSFGFASGEITLTDRLPAGMTFALAGDVSGDGWVCAVTLDPGAFTCTFDIANDWTLARGAQIVGRLGLSGTPGVGESLPQLTANVQVGDTSFFPSLNNDAKNVARLLHSGGSCAVTANGVSPDPALCVVSPQFDNVNDLQGGAIDINDLDDKSGTNNNVDSVTTNVRGTETDLGIDKFVNGVLEQGVGPSGQYTIAVTNFGPDNITPALTTPTITVTDTEPAFIQFVAIDAATDPGWICVDSGDLLPIDPATTAIKCDFTGTLLNGATSNIILNVEVTGNAGDVVSNTVSVDSGLFNFDAIPGNDADTDITAIVAPPVASQEKFLLSVSTALVSGNTSIGGLVGFKNDDLIIYDPVLDVATLFFDNAGLGFSIDDINAVHLLPNGHIILSPNGASSIGALNFDEGDLIRYDPIAGTAIMLFNGDAIFTNADENIDAVYVLDNGNIVFSTTADATIGAQSWDKSDLVEFDGVNASIYLSGADSNVFGAADDVQVDAAYIRVDNADATLVIDTFVFSTDDVLNTVGADSTSFGRDDLVELDNTAAPAASTSQTVFLGNLPLGVFSAVDPARRLDAVHILEDGYLGHFAISQSQAGSACEAGRITITKHQGVSHVIDTDYFGSIEITTSTNEGDWSIDTGSGTLVNFGSGAARYTFVPGDNGQVTLNLNVTEVPPSATSLNVDVSNGIVSELGTEDPNFNFNLVVTPVTYRDEFTLAAFDNNDGTTGWEGNWVEIDGFDGVSAGSGAGPSAGNVQISGGKLSLTSNPSTDGNFEPSMAREANIGLFTVTETTFLNFDYTYTSLNATDSLVVEVSDDGGAVYATATTITGITGSTGSAIPVSIDLGSVGGALDDFGNTLIVRYRIDNGYTLASTIFIDNVEIATGTTDCGIGVIDHFDIEVISSGIACVASTITIRGHDANHFPASPGNGAVINLSTSTGAGTWASILVGAGALVDVGAQGLPTNVDGQGSYTFFGDENLVQLQFNYTEPAGDTPIVNFDIAGVHVEQQNPGHDPSITFDDVGLLFYDENTSSTTMPFQIAGKPSLTLPSSGLVTLQIVRSVDVVGENEAVACESLVAAGTTARIKFAGLCVNPDSCAVSTMTIVDAVSTPISTVPVVSSPSANPEAAGLELDVLFATQPTIVDGANNIGAVINFMYPDAGEISLHAEFDIPFDNDVAGIRSGDTISGASETFIVRPFGFDVDFDNDRSGGGSLSLANDENGPAFARAGVGFSATVSAVVWEPGDDTDADGVPDFGADLSGNAVTANFGNESAIDHTVIVSVVTDDPGLGGIDDNPGVPGGELGSLVLGEVFDTFVNGSATTHPIAIDEVGIFDLQAVLVDNDVSKTPINYLGVNSEGVSGGVANVGRIYPANFKVVSSSFGPRVNQAMACAMTSPFTYMGEDFGLNMVIQAINGLGNDTLNYRDGFAKLTSFNELDIRAIIHESGTTPDNDLGNRLVNTSIDTLFTTPSATVWINGSLSISGDMNISRLLSGAEDAPLVGVQIAFGPVDDNGDGIGGGNDVVLDVLDVELDEVGESDPIPNSFRLIDTHEFRYGRLLIDNAYGPETEDLGIPLRIEYFDGSNFVVNTDDSCTSLLFDFNAPALTYVGTSYEAPLSSGDTSIEIGGDFTITLFQGQTNRLADGNTIDSDDVDRPFITSAPLGENTGRVLVEFDLSDASLPTSLDFLLYDWRGDPAEVDDYDEIPDGTYNNNPRGIVEFGTYRGHDRIINWQEIYIGPN